MWVWMFLKQWCGRWESNPHEEKSPEDFHAVCGFRRPDAVLRERSRPVCGLDYPFTLPRKIRGLGAARLVSTPSRLVAPGLARDCHYRFPRIWAVLHRRFPGEHSSFAQVLSVCHSATPAWVATAVYHTSSETEFTRQFPEAMVVAGFLSLFVFRAGS